MIKAIVFDLGGVVTNYSHQRFYHELAKCLKVNPNVLLPTLKSILKPFNRGEMDEDEFWRRLVENLQIELPANHKGFIRYEYEKDAKINKGIVKIIESLKKSDFKIALISDTIKSHALRTKEWGWFKYFDVVMLSCDVGLIKNNGKIFNLTLSKLGLKGNECIYIDDKKENLIPAKKVGMKVILYTSSQELKKDLKKLGAL